MQVWTGSESRISIFGFLVLGIGLFWLAKDLGWLSTTISTWTVIFVVVGLALVLNKLFR